MENLFGGMKMNNGKDYNYDKGAWVMKHPPPIEIFIGLKLIDLEPRGSWHFKHPPPKTICGNQN